MPMWPCTDIRNGSGRTTKAAHYQSHSAYFQFWRGSGIKQRLYTDFIEENAARRTLSIRLLIVYNISMENRGCSRVNLRCYQVISQQSKPCFGYITTVSKTGRMSSRDGHVRSQENSMIRKGCDRRCEMGNDGNTDGYFLAKSGLSPSKCEIFSFFEHARQNRRFFYVAWDGESH